MAQRAELLTLLAGGLVPRRKGRHQQHILLQTRDLSAKKEAAKLAISAKNQLQNAAMPWPSVTYRGPTPHKTKAGLVFNPSESDVRQKNKNCRS